MAKGVTQMKDTWFVGFFAILTGGKKGLSNKDDLDDCVHQFGYESIIRTVRPKTVHALFGPVSVFL